MIECQKKGIQSMHVIEHCNVMSKSSMGRLYDACMSNSIALMWKSYHRSWQHRLQNQKMQESSGVNL